MSESIISWVDLCISNTYYGAVPGEEHSYYVYHFQDREVYSLYERVGYHCWDMDRHVADFKHLENAKVYAEHIERNRSALLDVIIHSSLWKINAGD
jgi:hypothetical protein